RAPNVLSGSSYGNIPGAGVLVSCGEKKRSTGGPDDDNSTMRRRRCFPHIAGIVHGLGLCRGTVRSGKSIHVQLRSGPDLRSAGQGKWVLSEVGLQESPSERGTLKISLNRTDGVRPRKHRRAASVGGLFLFIHPGQPVEKR